MRRIALLTTVAGALVIAASATGAPLGQAGSSAAGASLGHTARTTTIQLRRTAAGRILATAGGRTIYMFTRDRRNRDTCAAISGCTGIWPLVTSSGRPVAGRGVSARLLGTIRVGRTHQVTYAGRPLYTYRGDTGPGQTDYIGINQFGGRWDGLTAQGKPVR